MRKNIDFLDFKQSDVVFILFINIKMPKIVDILTFMNRINFIQVELSMKIRGQFLPKLIKVHKAEKDKCLVGALRPSQQFFSNVRTFSCLPGLNQF